MMKTNVFFTLIALAICLNVNAQKITGYLPSYRNVTPVTNVQYDKLTDVVFAFINPDLTGNLITYNLNPASAAFDFEMSKFLEVKAHCKSYNVRLHIAVGGADGGNLRDARLASVCGAAGTRGALVTSLMNFAITHELAGVDIDWEFPNTVGERTGHENLLSELRTAINASSRPDLILSVAVGGEYPPLSGTSHLDYYNAGAVGYPDVFYIMAYDLPASYNANHSTLANATGSMNAWNATKGVPKAKMQLGVPFYARNAARTLIQEYNTLAAGAPATVFGADSYLFSGNTYYYNGGATLQSKVTEAITNQCSQGVMIWDLGEDRTDAYSLLGAINTRMTTLCNFTPNLGSDKTLCSGTVLLDCGLAAGGRTFVWTRNGVVMGGVTTPSTTVSQGGKYKVTVTQGCCIKYDEVEVLESATATGTGDTRCGTGVVNLAITSGAGTYNWYSSVTAGTKLATGISYNPSIAATTTYYVQRDYGNKTYTGAREYNTPASCWTERWENQDAPLAAGFPKWAQRITANTTITLESLKIWRSNTTVNNVVVKIYAADGGTLVATSAATNFTTNASASVGLSLVSTLPVNITLDPGVYFVGVTAPTAALGLYMLTNTAGPYTSTSVADVFTIDANTYQNFGWGFTGATIHYGTTFDWKISAPVTSACPRIPIVGTINCTPVVTLVAPGPPGPVPHIINTALSLSSTATDDGSIASVSYVIRRVSDNAIVATVPGGVGPNYTASWTPTISQDYTVTAVATDNGGLQGSSTLAIVTVSPLPVELVSFSGMKREEGNVLMWTTASEYNNSHFEIEKSSDGFDFKVIGKVVGKGNATEFSHYSYLDENPKGEVNFYRLNQFDNDEENTYSKIIKINNSIVDCFIAPNPFTTNTILELSKNQETQVEIRDMKGNLISTFKTTEMKMELGSDLKPGVYHLHIVSETMTYVFKIVKI